MVQILRQGGPQTVTVTGPKRGALEGVLETTAKSFNRGLGEGLSESFQEYFEEQREKKYNSIIDEELSKYAQEEGSEGEPTPRQLLRVAMDRKLPIRDQDRDRLMKDAQTMAVVERNQELEKKQSQSVSPEQEEAAIRVIQSLDPNDATEADVYNSLRTNAGLNARQAKVFVDEMWKPRKREIEDRHASELRAIDKEIADLNKLYAAPTNSDRNATKRELEEKLRQRGELVRAKRKRPSLQNSTGQSLLQKGMNFGVASRQQGQMGQQFSSPMEQGATGPSTNKLTMIDTLFQ